MRLLWVYLVRPEAGLVDDAGYYHFFARGFVAGHGYVRPEGTPTAFWPVGYPATLALVYKLFGASLLAAKLFNVLLGVATTALLYVLARRWFSRPQATVAALVYALWPGAVGFTSITMSETLFTFLFVASLTLLAWAPSWPRRAGPLSLAFAVLVAAANYVRVQTLLLAIVALPWLWYRGWPARRALVFAAVSLTVVMLLSVPWVVRNSLRFGELTFLATNSGTNFYQGHRAGANGGPDFHAQLAFAQRFDQLPRDKQEAAWNREGFRAGLDYLLGHPLAELRLSVLKVYQLYRADSAALLWNEQNGATPVFSDRARDRLTLLFDGYYYASGALALCGLTLGLWRRRDWGVFCALIAGYWTLGHVVFYGEPRLHVPLLPVFALLAAVPLWAAVSRLAESRRRFGAGRSVAGPMLK